MATAVLVGLQDDVGVRRCDVPHPPWRRSVANRTRNLADVARNMLETEFAATERSAARARAAWNAKRKVLKGKRGYYPRRYTTMANMGQRL